MNNLTKIKCPHCEVNQLYDFSIMKGLPEPMITQVCVECNKVFSPIENTVKEG